MNDGQEDSTLYKVVVNHEEQYSIWPVESENPLGWRDADKTGLKADCLAYIEETWVDMRPLSLRKHMEELAGLPPAESGEPPAVEEDTGGDLVQRLAAGSHAVEIGLRPEKSAEALRASIERGFVPIHFPETQGGTELGVRLDREASDLSQGDFENQTGSVRLVGGLVLDDVKVRCVADIDLAYLAGRGRLEVVAG